MIHITTHNETETLALARRIASTLKGGDVLLLQGDLGAGKTTFTRGLARALGIKTRIKSPTFTLMHVYRVTRYKLHVTHLVHCDAYRVNNAHALHDIGLMDYLGRPDTVVVIEWGEKIKPLLRGRRYTLIKFAHGKKPNERIIKITASTHKIQNPRFSLRAL